MASLRDRLASRFSSQIARHGQRNVQELAQDALHVLTEGIVIPAGGHEWFVSEVDGGDVVLHCNHDARCFDSVRIPGSLLVSLIEEAANP